MSDYFCSVIAGTMIVAATSSAAAPNNVTVTDSDIPKRAFYCDCTLQRATIAPTVSYIGFAAFGYCENLKRFIIEDSSQPIEMSCFEPAFMADIQYDYEGDGYGVEGHDYFIHSVELRSLYDGSTYTMLDSLAIGRNIIFRESVNEDAVGFYYLHRLYDCYTNDEDWEDVWYYYYFHDFEGLFKSQFNIKVLEIGRFVTSLDFMMLMPVQERLERIDIHQPKPMFDINPLIGDASKVVLHVPRGTANAWARNFRYSSFTIIDDLPNGDVNGDGKVDVGDVNTVLADILATGGNTAALDVNGDGKVDVGDVNYILEIILSNK